METCKLRRLLKGCEIKIQYFPLVRFIQKSEVQFINKKLVVNIKFVKLSLFILIGQGRFFLDVELFELCNDFKYKLKNTRISSYV